MAHFPQPQRNVRAPRVRIPDQAQVVFVAENRQIPAVLNKLSSTGGTACLARKCPVGLLAELRLNTTSGSVQALVEILDRPDPIVKEQPFRFVAMSDEDQQLLNSTLARLRRQGFGEAVQRRSF